MANQLGSNPNYYTRFQIDVGVESQVVPTDRIFSREKSKTSSIRDKPLSPLNKDRWPLKNYFALLVQWKYNGFVIRGWQFDSVVGHQIYRRIEESSRPRQSHKLEIGGANPSSATNMPC